MDQSIFHQQAQAAAGRREALRWLASRLNWEQRLGQLRPGGQKSASAGAKQAA